MTPYQLKTIEIQHRMHNRLRVLLKQQEGTPIEISRDFAVELHALLYEIKEFWEACWGGLILRPLPPIVADTLTEELFRKLVRDRAFQRYKASAEAYAALFNEFEEHLETPGDAVAIPRKSLERARSRIFQFLVILRRIEKGIFVF